MEYQKIKDMQGNERSDMIKRIKEDGTTSFIPEDMANNDWKEYQEWLAQGNEPEPAE